MKVPHFLVKRLDDLLRRQLEGAEGVPAYDFSAPAGEPALVDPASVSWRVFRNPLSIFIGGISAVLLELAEPRVRTGVWMHTTFRTEPLKRMRRTGLAAMVTVYGAKTTAEKMIAHVGKMHSGISGVTPDGVPYRADDPELLRWVHATAIHGFLEAYDRFVEPLPLTDRDLFVSEGVAAAGLYGVLDPPRNEADIKRLFHRMEPELQASETISDFLAIVSRLPVFPLQFRPLGRLLVCAAVDIVPQDIRVKLGLQEDFRLSGAGDALLRFLGGHLDRLQLDSGRLA